MNVQMRRKWHYIDNAMTVIVLVCYIFVVKINLHTMGIKQLMQLLTDKAPDCYKPITLDQLSGRVLALDASIALYQFLIST